MVEEKIYDYLINNQQIAQFLTSYGGKPAVFLQEAPADTAAGWDGGQYGRLVFGVDYAGDPERSVSATLWVDVYSHKDGPDPEEIAPVISDEMDNRFFADGNEVIALAWNATSGFQETRNDKLVNGVSLTFDVLYFPEQLTTEPDPVKAINWWTKERIPHALIIGVDELPESWTPRENPTIYWRLGSIGPSTLYPDTFNCTWHSVDLSGHFMIDDTNTRLTVCKAIIDELAAAEPVIMADKSPMFVTRIAARTANDAIKTGQITVSASYGVLRKYREVPKLNVAVTSATIEKG
jgi:hypothetical protein